MVFSKDYNDNGYLTLGSLSVSGLFEMLYCDMRHHCAEMVELIVEHHAMEDVMPEFCWPPSIKLFY
jgi:hypothetical protein